MSELVFDCLGAEPDPFCAGPTLTFALKISEVTGERIHAIALRIQMRIEPKRRRYSEAEGKRLLDLFGEKTRWSDTVRPMQFAFVDVMVPSFTGSIELDVPVPCSYDLEVASSKYFHALDDGDIPLLFLFSGTMFTKGETGFMVEQVPWHKEVTYNLPVKTWDELMDVYFPGSTWLRLDKTTLDALALYKSQKTFTGWDETVLSLLAGNGSAATIADGASPPAPVAPVAPAAPAASEEGTG